MASKLASVLDDQVGRLTAEHDACVNALSFAGGHAGEAQARANERAAYQRLIDAANARDAVHDLLSEFRLLLTDCDDSGVTAYVAGKGFDKSIERARNALASIGGA